MAWRDYEEEVAAFMRERGWTAERGAEVQGVRTKHRIDVLAMTDQLGVVTQWLIECKDWNKRVSKDKVLILRKIVEETGSDRGLILNEKGFQKGAYEAAQSTNVTVTTLADLGTVTSDLLQRVRYESAHKTLVDLVVRVHRLTISRGTDGHHMTRARKGVRDQNWIARLGAVGVAEDSVARARAGHLPQPMPDFTGSDFSRCTTDEEMLIRAAEVIAWMEPWLEDQEAGVDEANGWEEQQYSRE